MRLSSDEIKLVVFVLLSLLVGATVKHYRARQPMPVAPAAAQVVPGPRVAVDSD
jgi:hypothetical protein